MKKHVFLSVFVVLSMAVSAQGDTVGYRSIFGDSNSIWNVYMEFDGILGGTEVRQAVVGDTLDVEGKTYNVIRCLTHAGIGCSYDGLPQYLRESEDHSKLYFKEYYDNIEVDEYDTPFPDSIPEILIMDLNLTVGDTLETANWIELFYYKPETVQYIKIDSVYYMDGHKVLQTNCIRQGRYDKKDTLLFIEGIGPTFGPLYPGRNIYISLLCYHRDDTMLYHHDGAKDPYDIDDCLYSFHSDTWGITGEAEGLDYFRIYPNPVQSRFSIVFQKTSTFTIAVTSSNGLLISKKECCAKSCEMDTKGWPSGVYYVTVRDRSHSLTEKIIKL